MARSAFEELEVYELAERLANEVWQVVISWGMFDRDTLGKQAVRAADSIGANIAEGFGRGSAKENSRFVRIARGSLNEVIHWMRTAFQRRLLTERQVARIKSLIDELGPKLNGYLRSLNRSNRPAGGVGGRHQLNGNQRTTNNVPLSTNKRPS